jgi:membrane protein implicated in regulation of membrane protease activity
VGNLTERLEAAMLWLSLLSFGAGFALVATAAYYGSIYMALMTIFSFITGVLLYYAYRAPALFEGADSPDETRSREARHEFVFLISLLLIATVFYGVLANVFYNMFSNTEVIIIYALPLSFVPLGLVIVVFGFLKRPPESLSQPEEKHIGKEGEEKRLP